MLANRLSEDSDAKVLLLEAGGPDDNPDIQDPHRMSALMNGPENWAYTTAPQQYCYNRERAWPRGKVLGGTSSINGTIYIRGHRSDYDAWAYQGNAGWDIDHVLPYFRKSEDFDGGASRWHAEGGPLHVISYFEPHPVSAAIVAAGREIELPYTDDLNAEQMEGIGFAHLINPSLRWETSTFRFYEREVSKTAGSTGRPMRENGKAQHRRLWSKESRLSSSPPTMSRCFR